MKGVITLESWTGWILRSLAVFVIGLVILQGSLCTPKKAFSMEVPRINVQEGRELAFTGDAILVCAYEGEDRFRSMPLEGAISLESFREITELVAETDKKIIFY
jgi:hypothetical protein